MDSKYFLLNFELFVAVIGSTNQGATATFGEQGVYDCLAMGKPIWECYTEQRGFNPQW